MLHDQPPHADPPTPGHTPPPALPGAPDAPVALTVLLDGLADVHRDAAITGLADDSRAVRPGDLFLARSLEHVPDALARGAAAVLLPDVDAQPDAAPVAPPAPTGLATAPAVDQPLAGRVAEAFHGHPARSLRCVAITGTNGKTTTATLTQHLLACAGRKPGLLGTVAVDTGDPAGPRPASLTTPGALQLSALLAEMRDHGRDTCVLEASSHALDQGRTDHLADALAVGVFTNLTQDHLDYHGSMDAYAGAKARLFTQLPEHATAVVNADDPAATRMTAFCRAGVVLKTHLKPGTEKHAGETPDLALAFDHDLAATRSQATMLGPWGVARVVLPMAGRHNLSNALQAACAAYAVQPFGASDLERWLADAPPVPGRLEPVPNPRFPLDGVDPAALPAVLVDYAHTPDAVAHALAALRPVTPGRLVIVLGCGGDRDRAKRPLMAAAALAGADLLIATSDNPRTEPSSQILDDMLQGVADDARVTRIADRAEAIRHAISSASPADTVLLAGKGHEDYQIIGDVKHDFDDRLHALDALRERPQ